MSWDITLEPPRGFEPRTYALREREGSSLNVFGPMKGGPGMSLRMSITLLPRYDLRNNLLNHTTSEVTGSANVTIVDWKTPSRKSPQVNRAKRCGPSGRNHAAL